MPICSLTAFRVAVDFPLPSRKFTTSFGKMFIDTVYTVNTQHQEELGFFFLAF